MKLFGGSKEKPANPQEAIQRLRETTEMLQKKSDFLEKKIENEVQTAKKHGTKNKRSEFSMSSIFIISILYLCET